MATLSLGPPAIGFSIGRSRIAVAATPVIETTLRREADGTVTVLRLGAVPTPTLTRQPDGTVTVS